MLVTAVLAGAAGPPVCAQTNLASAREGAAVVAVSSSRGGQWDTKSLIDGDPATTWATAPGKAEDEWVVVKLATRRAVEIGAIAIDNTPSAGSPPEAALRDYRLLVSTTGRAPDDFTQVEIGSCRMGGGRQVLTFVPARAQFVKLVLRRNHGHPDWTEVAELEVYPAGAAPVAAMGLPAVLLYSRAPDPNATPFAALSEALSAVGASVATFPANRGGRDLTLNSLIGVRVVVVAGDPTPSPREIEALVRFCRRGGGLVCAVESSGEGTGPLLAALGGSVAPSALQGQSARLSPHWITEGLAPPPPISGAAALDMPGSTPLALVGDGVVVGLAAQVDRGFLVALPYTWLATGSDGGVAAEEYGVELARRAVLWAAGMEEMPPAEPSEPVRLDGRAILMLGEDAQTLGRSFDTLQAALRDRGLRITQLREPPDQFRAADLGDADLVIAYMPVVSDEGALDLSRWVAGGGALLVLGDPEAPVDRLVAMNALLREFNTAVAAAPGGNLAVAVRHHPATAGVDALSRPGHLLGVWSLQGTTLAEMAGSPVAIVRTYGQGRLAVIDGGFAVDPVEPPPGRKKAASAYGIQLARNEQFLVQIVAWLLGAE